PAQAKITVDTKNDCETPRFQASVVRCHRASFIGVTERVYSARLLLVEICRERDGNRMNDHDVMKRPSPQNARQWLIQYRRLPLVVLHVGLVALANYIAFWLRFENAVPRWEFYQPLPALLIIRSVLFVPFRLYEGLWRYTSIEDLRNIVAGVGLSSCAFALYVYGYLGMVEYPRSVLFID